jgi:hypothetical protein
VWKVKYRWLYYTVLRAFEQAHSADAAHDLDQKQVSGTLNYLSQEIRELRGELSNLVAANASLAAVCSDETRQRLALAEQVTSLLQIVSGLQGPGQQLPTPHAIAVATATMSQPAPAAATATPPPNLKTGLPLAALVDECDTVIGQFAHVPALWDAIQLRDGLEAQLEAVERIGDDYELIGTLGEQLLTLRQKVAEQPLSEEDYVTLADRHELLVQKVINTCATLARAKAYADVKLLGAKLKELKALDVSALPQSWANDPVQPPAPPTTVKEGEDDGANDPVYVPSATDETTIA